MSTFEFVVVSSLRVAQLMRGCTARVVSDHKVTVTAQLEVAAGAIIGERMPSARVGSASTEAGVSLAVELVPAALALTR